MTLELYNEVTRECSKLVTVRYSTSFSSAIRLLHKALRDHIFNIYGFVRLADEIVDTFHGYDKTELLQEFKRDTFSAIEDRISLNPILNSFQATVNRYKISRRLIEAFFSSMESDLKENQYDRQAYEEYIYGSAEVVGLMCLCVFCEGDMALFSRLEEPAKALGAAFQKVNFLRDIHSDFTERSRMYFPGCNFHRFADTEKRQIEAEIEQDFNMAFKGIAQLPLKARFGVYVAYKYYLSLFRKIRRKAATTLLTQRIRIPNYYKAYIVIKAGVAYRFRLFETERWRGI